MFKPNKIEIKWGNFEFKGRAELLPYVMDELFARMPPDKDYSKRVMEEQKAVDGNGGYI